MNRNIWQIWCPIHVSISSSYESSRFQIRKFDLKHVFSPSIVAKFTLSPSIIARILSSGAKLSGFGFATRPKVATIWKIEYPDKNLLTCRALCKIEYSDNEWSNSKNLLTCSALYHYCQISRIGPLTLRSSLTKKCWHWESDLLLKMFDRFQTASGKSSFNYPFRHQSSCALNAVLLYQRDQDAVMGVYRWSIPINYTTRTMGWGAIIVQLVL